MNDENGRVRREQLPGLMCPQHLSGVVCARGARDVELQNGAHLRGARRSRERGEALNGRVRAGPE